MSFARPLDPPLNVFVILIILPIVTLVETWKMFGSLSKNKRIHRRRRKTHRHFPPTKGRTMSVNGYINFFFKKGLVEIKSFRSFN